MTELFVSLKHYGVQTQASCVTPDASFVESGEKGCIALSKIVEAMAKAGLSGKRYRTSDGLCGVVARPRKRRR